MPKVCGGARHLGKEHIMAAIRHNLVLILYMVLQTEQILLPTLLWDPRNPLFQCSTASINVVQNDKLNILCPSKALNTGNVPDILSASVLFENAYLLQPDQKDQYEQCNSTDGRLVVNCDTPNDLKFVTLNFKAIAGSSSAFTFQRGLDYYLIGTGHHTSATLNDRVGGSCAGSASLPVDSKLKLKIHVCSDDEINVYKNCTICSSLECYYEDCATYSSWHEVDYVWNGTHCLELQERYCLSDDIHCTQPLSRHFALNGSGACDLPTTVCPSQPSTITTTVSSSPSCSTIVPGPVVGRNVDDDESQQLYIGVGAGLAGGLFIGVMITWLIMYQSRKRKRRRDSAIKKQQEVNGQTNAAYCYDTLQKDTRSNTELKLVHNGDIRP